MTTFLRQILRSLLTSPAFIATLMNHVDEAGELLMQHVPDAADAVIDVVLKVIRAAVEQAVPPEEVAASFGSTVTPTFGSAGQAQSFVSECCDEDECDCLASELEV